MESPLPKHRFLSIPDQHRGHRHDGEEASVQDLPPADDQPFTVGLGKLAKIFEITNSSPDNN